MLLHWARDCHVLVGVLVFSYYNWHGTLAFLRVLDHPPRIIFGALCEHATGCIKHSLTNLRVHQNKAGDNKRLRQPLGGKNGHVDEQRKQFRDSSLTTYPRLPLSKCACITTMSLTQPPVRQVNKHHHCIQIPARQPLGNSRWFVVSQHGYLSINLCIQQSIPT